MTNLYSETEQFDNVQKFRHNIRERGKLLMPVSKKPIKRSERILVIVALLAIILCIAGVFFLHMQNKALDAEYESARAELENTYQYGTTQERIDAALTLAFGDLYEVVDSEYKDGEIAVVLHAAEEPSSNVIRHYAKDTVFIMSWIFGIPEIEKFSVTFKHTLLDKGGNEVLADAFIIGISRENADDINYENFVNMVWEDPTLLTDRADGYLIIPALRE